MAALVRPPKRLLRLIQLAPLGKQHAKIERALGNAALISPMVGRLSIGYIASLFEQDTEIRSTSRVAALVRPPERLLRLIQLAPLGKQHAKIERALGNAALISPTVGRLSTGYIASLFEQDTEIRSTSRVAALVRPPKRLLRLIQLAPLGKQHAKIERGLGNAALIWAAIGRLQIGGIGTPHVCFRRVCRPHRHPGAVAALLQSAELRVTREPTAAPAMLSHGIDSDSPTPWRRTSDRRSSAPRDPLRCAAEDTPNCLWSCLLAHQTFLPLHTDPTQVSVQSRADSTPQHTVER